MEQEKDEQWSWWQTPDTPPTSNPATTPGAHLTSDLPTTDSAPADTIVLQHDERVRKALIGLVALLTISLAAASYVRFGPDGTAQTVASASVDPPSTATATTGNLPTTSQAPVTTTSQPTTALTTTSAVPKTSSTTVPVGGAPKPPVNVSVVSTGPTWAEIHWESAECVGSLYQVGNFSEGRGGYPNVDRCWFNHVVLAGNESFSPPLTPNTEYVVRVQAVNKSGQTSDPVEITFRTTSG